MAIFLGVVEGYDGGDNAPLICARRETDHEITTHTLEFDLVTSLEF